MPEAQNIREFPGFQVTKIPESRKLSKSRENWSKPGISDAKLLMEKAIKLLVCDTYEPVFSRMLAVLKEDEDAKDAKEAL